MDIKERIKDLSLDQKAKLYFMGLLRKGVIDTLPEDPKAAYIRDMMDKEDPRMDPDIRSDFDDPTLENLKEASTELGYLKEGIPQGSEIADYVEAMFNDSVVEKEGFQSDIWTKEEYASTSRDEGSVFMDLAKHLNSVGGRDVLEGNPDIHLELLSNGDIQWSADVTLDENLNEGDTYEKMAAKGKKKGNLKQGTVRKRLKIKDGEKIPLSKINKAISKIKKMENPSEKNKKFLKALNLAKTLKTTTNVNEEEDPVVAKGDGMEITRKEMAMLHKNGKVRLKDGSLLTFIGKKDKANLNEEQMPEKITFSYTDPGFSFYKMYYSINKQRKKLRSVGEANQFLKTLGIEEEVPRRYNETVLDKIVRQLETKGIEAEHNAFMDVS